mgnify:FL=1
MKKYFVFTLLVLFFNLFSFSQEFLKKYGQLSGESSRDIIELSDGNFMIAGAFTDTISNTIDALLMKVDTNGVIIWSKTYGGAQGDDVFNSLIEDNGLIYACGYTTSYSSDTVSDVYLVKTDLNGNISWSETYGGTGCAGPYCGDVGHKIIKEANNSYIISGRFASSGSDLMAGYILRIDDTGNLVDEYIVDGNGSEWFTNVSLAQNGDLLFSGVNKVSTWEPWLYRMHPTGYSVFNKGYGTVVDHNGGLGAVEYSNEIYFLSNKAPNICLSKLDANGDTLKVMEYGTSVSVKAQDIFLSSDNNLFILANVGSQSILMKTDLNGDTLWVNHYNNSGFAQKLIEKNNHIYILGYSSSFGNGSNDITLMKVKSDGSSSNCIETTSSTFFTNPSSVLITTWTEANTSYTSSNTIFPSTINISLEECQACIVADFDFSVFNNLVVFNNLTDQGVSYDWSFGDFNSSSDESPTNTYLSYGTYNACLVAFDNCSSDTICKIIQVDNIGCTDSIANNYNPFVNIDDGSCLYSPFIFGCTDATALNYNSLATVGDSSCCNNSDQLLTQLGNDIDGEGSSNFSGKSISISGNGSIIAIGADHNNNNNGVQSGHVRVYENLSGSWSQIGQDIDGENPFDYSGNQISLNNNGNILAIGASYNNQNGLNSGHVRVYEYISGNWNQIGQDIDGETSGSYSGHSVSLSGDGNTVAIGAPYNYGNGSNSGHVRVYENIGGSWLQTGQDIDGEAAGDASGYSVSLSNGGNIVAIGASGNDGNGSNSGHVRIYENIGGSWLQTGQDIDGEAIENFSGWSVELSANGNTVAIGAKHNNGNGLNSGHVRVYENISGTWVQVGQDIDGESTLDWSGWSVSLSGDGNTVAIGAPHNGSNGYRSGHVRLYSKILDINLGTYNWTQIGQDIDGEAIEDQSGYSVSLSNDGATVSIGALYNDGNSSNSGHVRVYSLSNPCTDLGCLDPLALNFDPNATVNDSTCIYPNYGCIDSVASNYNYFANIDDGSCIYCINDTSYTNIIICDSILWNGELYDSSGVYSFNSYSPFNNYSLDFDGTPSTEAVFSNLSSLDSSDGDYITVSFWMDWNEGDECMPISFLYYDLIFYSGGFGFNHSQGDNYGISDSLLSGGWQHITAVFYDAYSGENAHDFEKLYINGVEQVLSYFSPPNVGLGNPTPSNVDFSNQELLVGSIYSNLFYEFNGKMDELSVWNGELSNDQIQNLVNCPPNGDEVDLVGYWNFEEGSGSTVYDQTSNGYNGFTNNTTYDSNVPLQTCLLTNTNGNGCDSVAILNLTINPSSISIFTTNACDSYNWNGSTYTSTGLYTNLYTDINGCDSTVILDLTINNSSTSTFTITSCNSYDWDGVTYTSTGLYSNIYSDLNGCDSTVTLDLTINNSSTSTLIIISCDSYDWDGFTYTSTGLYTNIYTGTNGCDSTVTLDLTINNSSTSTLVIISCDAYDWDGLTYTNTGLYTNFYTDLNGCDSTVTLDLTINNSSTSTLIIISCDSYDWDGVTYISTGLYTNIYTDLNGCDSTVNLDLTINNSSIFIATITSCDSYDWNEATYTSTGLYTNIYTGTNGCDSTVSLDLTINNSSTSTVTIISCDSYDWDGVTYTSTGLYTNIYAGTNGCDSTVILDLTINNSSTSTLIIISCDSYDWDGVTYISTGLYTNIYTDLNGCDSTVTLDLTINNSSNSTSTIIYCDSYDWSGATYTSTGLYTNFYTDVNGCDSTVSLDLTINNSSTSTVTIISCDSYDWDGVTYTSTGLYTNIYAGTNGCDSTVILDLTINNSSTSTLIIISCDSYDWDGVTYISTGLYTNIYSDLNGCDSTVTLDLTINNSSSSSFDITACDDFTWDGLVYDSSGSFTNIYTGINGCDSLVTLNLTIDNSSAGFINITACDSFTWDGVVYNSTGSFINIYTGANGCDSSMTLNLIINNSTIGSVDITACDSYTWDGVVYNASGSYANMYTDMNGCDSSMTLNLTINNSSADWFVIEACDDFTWDGVVYTNTGFYTNTYSGVNGCDSSMTLHLTINNSSSNSVSIISCDDFTWDGVVYNTSGTYTNMYTDINGCDSSMTIVLTINYGYVDWIYVTACNNFTWEGVVYNASGSYTTTYTGANECDSSKTLYLTIRNSSSGSVDISVCDNFIWDGVIYNSSGSYTNMYTDINGCDSSMTLNLTVDSPVLQILFSNSNLIANVTGGLAPYSYNWSTGETTETITPAVPGSYWCIVTNSLGCISDTAFTVSTNIFEIDISQLYIYPNPSRDIFNISFTSQRIQDLNIKIFNSLGAEVYNENKEKFIGEYTKQITLGKFRKGIYFLEIETNNGIINKKIILQ